jgi:hypothetical protein
VLADISPRNRRRTLFGFVWARRSPQIAARDIHVRMASGIADFNQRSFASQRVAYERIPAGESSAIPTSRHRESCRPCGSASGACDGRTACAFEGAAARQGTIRRGRRRHVIARPSMLRRPATSLRPTTAERSAAGRPSTRRCGCECAAAPSRVRTSATCRLAISLARRPQQHASRKRTRVRTAVNSPASVGNNSAASTVLNSESGRFLSAQ